MTLKRSHTDVFPEVHFEVGPGVVFFGALRVLTMELVFVLVRFEMVTEDLV